jgi:sulfur-oxidizing protein SoxZ
MADPMKIRATMAGDKVEVRVLMSHEMETGQRKDSKGATIPAWFIQNVTATHNGKTVLSAEWGPAVSKNPFLSFKFAGGKPGDKVVITWDRQQGRQAHRRGDHRMMRTFLAAAAMAAASHRGFSRPGDPVKVVYHMNEDVDRAPQALRNVSNHLSVDPKAKIVFVSHAAGITSS